MLKITEPGIYDCSDDAYQSDPCEQISLRSSTASTVPTPPQDKGPSPTSLQSQE